jgi:hypothetical protein
MTPISQIDHATQHRGADILALWECAASRTRIERDDALLARGNEPSPRSLGLRHAQLLQLRASIFGNTLALRSSCPHCSETVEFAVRCGELASSLLPRHSAELPQQLTHEGWHVDFRVPDIDDLRSVAHESNPAAYAIALNRRCLLRCTNPQGEQRDVGDMPESLLAAISTQMEALEPGASVSFQLLCPSCDAGWDAHLDIGEVFWSELQQQAERVLLDVDCLARTYGWTEPEILALSPIRRAAYLQLAGVSP